mgnify:CR=1 FL=1
MDRRQQKTKIEIKKALLGLLKNKNLHELTVVDVCNKANIGRSTFYLHYADINQLMEEIEDEQLNYILQICLKYYQINIKIVCTEVAKYVKKNLNIYKTLLLKTNSHFENKVKIKYSQVFNDFYHRPKEPSFIKYYFSFITNGAIGVFKDWIIDDCIIDETMIVDNFISYLKKGVNVE